MIEILFNKVLIYVWFLCEFWGGCVISVYCKVYKFNEGVDKNLSIYVYNGY